MKIAQGPFWSSYGSGALRSSSNPNHLALLDLACIVNPIALSCLKSFQPTFNISLKKVAASLTGLEFKAPFTLTLLRFCNDPFLLHGSYKFILFCSYTKTEGIRGKRPFLSVHIDLPDEKYGAKDVRRFAFTLFRFL